MTPETRVRKCAHSLGYRFRLHRADLPGKPDLVFPARRKAIFVHGCFWHQHASDACRRVHAPKSNLEYWVGKLQRNVERDTVARADLEQMGWQSLVLWECELKDEGELRRSLREFLG